MADGVRFIRVHGRVVPVRHKSNGGGVSAVVGSAAKGAVAGVGVVALNALTSAAVTGYGKASGKSLAFGAGIGAATLGGMALISKLQRRK